MEVLALLIIMSLVLAALAVGFYVWSVRQRTLDHIERLPLLPLEPDTAPLATPATRGSKEN